MEPAISSNNEQFIQNAIATGLFQDRAEAINAGIDLLRRQNALIDRLKESRRQLDQGQYTEYDQPGLRQLFEDLKGRARASTPIAN